jgi:hypothetical protein
METIYSASQDFQLDIIQVMITGLILFAAGYWLANLRSKKFLKEMRKLEKEIMDLNSELLYNEKMYSDKVKASSTMAKTTNPN